MAGAQMVTAPGRAAELAVPLSIAVRIEPDLVRAMRLAVLPYLDVAAESDLWFSDLVASREPDSIIFEPEILPALRRQLADWLAHSEPADPVRAVWDIIKRVHAGVSPALLLEERVAWLAVSAGDSGVPAIEDELRSALSSLLVEGRTGIADWFAGAWGRFPDTVRNTRVAWQLRQVASRYIAAADLRLEGVPARLGVADADAPPRESQAGGPVPLRVFVSSASGALAAYRQAAVEVCHRLRLTPVHMEEFDPRRPTPEQVSQREVDSSDVFVLLLAHRYGARPPGGDLSYTELEYRWAAKRPEMRVLAFVADPDFPWPPGDIDRGADADALARFVAQVRSRHEVRPLADVGAFRENLLIALSRLAAVPSTVGQGKPEPPAKAGPTAPEFLAVPPYVGSAPFTGRAADLAVLDEWGRSADPVMVVESIGGTGKSALTWQWAQDQAPAVIGGLAGRLWWSFYEGSASITRFLQELLAYTSGQPMPQIRRVNRTQLADEALAALRRHPYLVVLDGFERLLAAYHRFDPSKLRDEEAGPDRRALIEAQADEVVRRLADAGPSKILISTRLMPVALQGRFGQRMPGVQHLRLPGLTDADTRALLNRLDVHGSEPAVAAFFGPLDNHPLLAGVVAGMVRDYRAEPGGFDRWLADPTAGGALHLSDLDLTQRRTHILAAALDGLQSEARRLLGWLSVLAGSVSWPTLEAINPFRPEPPSAFESDLAAWRSSEPVRRATAQLDAALKDLEERGLLWWDRSSNSYDLHPIIRAYAYERLEAADQAQASDRVRDHFQTLPPEDPDRAASVEDLAQTITIFRALTSVGHLDEADLLWSAGLSRALLVNLGAYATVTELLAPVANDGTLGTRNMRGDLAAGYRYLSQYDRAISQETSRLAEVLGDEAGQPTRTCLLNLGAFHRSAGAYVAAVRYYELRASLNAAAGIEGDGSLSLNRAALAAHQGQAGQARELLRQAEGLGPDSPSPWFEEDIGYFRLYLALVADQSLTHAELDAAAARARSRALRRNLAGLRTELFVRQGQLEQALTAAQEHEQLGRNAGLEVAPAATAFLLAKLGRASEAAAAVEESLARLPRIYPTERPYLYLARALWELGRTAEAVSQARSAYQQAWGDGPPHCRYWDLRDARELLQTIGEAVPDLPTTDPATVTVPLEEKIRTFIAALESRTWP